MPAGEEIAFAGSDCTSAARTYTAFVVQTKVVNALEVLADSYAPIDAKHHETLGQSAMTPTWASSTHPSETVNHELNGQTQKSIPHKILHQCPKCSKVFRHASQLRQHLETHSDSRSYKCDFCATFFRSLRSQRGHLVGKHFDRLAAGERTGDMTDSRFLNWKVYLCQYCGKILRTQAALDAHAGVHTGERPYACEVCKNTFKTPSSLTRHTKQCHRESKEDTLLPPKKAAAKFRTQDPDVRGAPTFPDAVIR
ncbi:hypothetical protein T265_03732 [Opisthorchis viverrini]|uniref:C2H2-type domain-containing protein n=1 Tax=Opisthorchis viverrini TaxID=6198 RepID=A0A075A2G7_OPIVI|nr:hypothetical protein T265_03732 [Opisthorchis viverrini]KER29715.1 hypothetical protein T265_03732 [Opisthorchis viverrini]